MLYSSLQVGEKEYKLRLTAKNAIALEKSLGRHPLAVIMELSEEALPSTEDMCKILHASLQTYHHDISLDDTYDIYDNMIADGKSFADVILILVQIFNTAGFIPEETEIEAPAEEDSEETKNA